jgi:hypothetical protein
MKKILNLVLCASVLGTSMGAFAAPDAAVDGNVTIRGNKAGNVTTRGGSLSIGKGLWKAGELDMSAGANVNSVVVNGGAIKGNVTIRDNEVGDVTATGGMINVNSLVVNSK